MIMISSAAYSSHPFFRFKSEPVAEFLPISKTKTVPHAAKEKSLNTFKSRPQKLTCRWVSTGKSYPKMELEWTVVEPHPDHINIED